jgi:hypothetical protein
VVKKKKLQGTGLPKIVGHGLWAAARLNVLRWDRALRNLRESQENQLLDFIRHAQHTHFGRAHNFDKLRSYDDFKVCVSLGDYDTFSPAIDRMRAGERNLLVPEWVSYFCNSSGTSTQGKAKFLPVTQRQIAFQRQSATDSLFRFVVRRGIRDFSQGYSLGLFPPTTMRKEGRVWITCNPALMIATMPRVARSLYLPDDDIMRMSDYDQKLEMIAERYLDHDVRMITGTTCWFSLLFDRLLEAARRRGRKASTVTELWPNLQVLVGGGVSAEPYVEVLKERLGRDDLPLVDTYNATEGGIFAATDQDDTRGMLMLPHRGVFYEFIPADELDSPNPTRVPLWDVEPERLYGIAVTTPSGLYAYQIGDLVRFASISPLRIEYAGRTSGCLSTTQELTTHIEIQNAFKEAQKVSAATAVDFSAGADVGIEGTSKSRYVLFAEFSQGREPADPQAFIRAFDHALCQQNRVYREHRDGAVALLPPELAHLQPNAVSSFMQDVGNTSVQSKFPRIIDHERKSILRAYTQHSTYAD